jgi:hypothetical protein
MWAGGEWCLSTLLVSTPLSLLTDENSAVTKAAKEEEGPGLPATSYEW